MSFNVNPNIRKSKESQQAYKLRLREARQASRGRPGIMLWPSELLGSYVKRVHGELTKTTAARFLDAVQRLRVDQGVLAK